MRYLWLPLLLWLLAPAAWAEPQALDACFATQDASTQAEVSCFSKVVDDCFAQSDALSCFAELKAGLAPHTVDLFQKMPANLPSAREEAGAYAVALRRLADEPNLLRCATPDAVTQAYCETVELGVRFIDLRFWGRVAQVLEN